MSAMRPEPTMGDAAAVCRQRGWAVAFVEGQGWRPCDPADPGAYIDLERYVFSLKHEPAALDGSDATVRRPPKS